MTVLLQKNKTDFSSFGRRQIIRTCVYLVMFVLP